MAHEQLFVCQKHISVQVEQTEELFAEENEHFNISTRHCWECLLCSFESKFRTRAHNILLRNRNH